MKYYLQTLAKVLLPTLGGLIVGSLVAGILITLLIKPALTLDTLVDGTALALMGAIVAVVPTFLWGALLYAFVLTKGKASYFSATLIGAIPGLVFLLPQRTGFAELSLYFGVLIGSCTHFFAKLKFSANPFKRDT